MDLLLLSMLHTSLYGALNSEVRQTVYPKGNIPLMTSKQSPSGRPAMQPFHTVLVRAKLNTVRSGPADGADGPDA